MTVHPVVDESQWILTGKTEENGGRIQKPSICTIENIASEEGEGYKSTHRCERICMFSGE